MLGTQRLRDPALRREDGEERQWVDRKTTSPQVSFVPARCGQAVSTEQSSVKHRLDGDHTSGACDDDPDVVCAVARLFWNDRKLDKARAWFNRAATLRPEDGDVWVRYYAFEKSLEDDAESNVNPLNAKKAKKAKDDDTTTSPKEDILARASKASPNRGRYWAPVRKDFNNWRDSVSETVLKVLAKMESEGEFSS